MGKTSSTVRPVDAGLSMKLPSAQTPTCFKIIHPRKPVEFERTHIVLIGGSSTTRSFPRANVRSAMAAHRSGLGKRMKSVCCWES